MDQEQTKFIGKIHSRSQIFRELMEKEIREILLVSSPYNIFNLEEDGGLTERIINEYRELNLTCPPRISGVSSTKEALVLLKIKDFDMVLIVPHLENRDVFSLGLEIKKIRPNLQVILLSSSIRGIYPLPKGSHYNGIDKIFIWSGNSDLLLAMIKNAEDHLNVEQDTQRGNVQVLLIVEDSPEYYSFYLPIIYKEIIKQTQALLNIRFNEYQRLLTMRTRPKVLFARSYEEAMELYQKYRSFILCVLSDTRIPRKGKIDAKAGIHLISQIRKNNYEVPLLLMSSESNNREKAEKMSVAFLDKNSPDLLQETHSFFQTRLGFGDFVFRMPDGREIDQASNLQQLEAKLSDIPDQSVSYHVDSDDFSIWLMARSEISLALKFRSIKSNDFNSIDALRQHLISNIHELRLSRQKGLVSRFDSKHFDSDVREFVKIGQGSLGGKARGLAFMSTLFQYDEELHKKYYEFNIRIPKTLVICTDVFESFVTQNNLQRFVMNGFADQKVDEHFLNAPFPEWLMEKLEAFLMQVKYPLSIRSSSQLEDAHFHPYAGLYRTYMIPNNHSALSIRLSHLVKAIKLVYASTYYEEPKALFRNTSKQPFNESMAIIIQEVAGDVSGDYFYPTISGVAQSYNFYPFSYMKSEEGIAHIALGLGKTVVEGEHCLRFSPKHPNIMPQFSSVQDILKNTQYSFYALKINNYPDDLNFEKYTNLEKRDIDDAKNEFSVKALASTYVAEENRIRDTWHTPGPKVITFAQLLKYNTSRFPELLHDLLELGQKGLGCPVEIEFSVNLHPDGKRKTDIFFLQIRPMLTDGKRSEVQITEQEIKNAFCYSSRALGNGIYDEIADIVYVKPDNFKSEETIKIAEEINWINTALLKEKRSYFLIGPGRWGSSDRFLGIPVKWRNISGVKAIIELRNEKLNVDPSQGTHFFHNITSQGVNYITVNEIPEVSQNGLTDYFDWQWINSLPAVSETAFMRHVKLEKPLLLKIDGKKSQCVIMRN